MYWKQLLTSSEIKYLDVLGVWDTNEFPIEDLVRAATAIAEINLRQPKIQVMGSTVIVDLEGITIKHIAAMTPTVAYQIVCLLGVSCLITF